MADWIPWLFCIFGCALFRGSGSDILLNPNQDRNSDLNISLLDSNSSVDTVPQSPNWKEHFSNRSCGVDVSLTREFSVVLCWDLSNQSRFCGSGSFIIIRNQCPYEPSNQVPVITSDAATLALIENTIGYDSFYIKISGPEVFVANAVPIPGDRCAYQVPFQLRSSGNYTTSAVWMYTDGRALNEKDPHPHPPFYVQLFRQTIPMIECGPQWRQRQSQSQPQPVCNATSVGTQPGRWAVGTNGSRIWTPDSCRFAPLSGPNMAACLKGKRILFMGDSHTRMSYCHVSQALFNVVGSGGNRSDLAGLNKKPPVFYRFFSSNFSANGGTTLFYDMDYWLNHLARLLIHRRNISSPELINILKALDDITIRTPFMNLMDLSFDVVVTSFGQHPATGNWPFQRYQKYVSMVVNLIQDQRLIWMLPPATPPRQKCELERYRLTYDRERMMSAWTAAYFRRVRPDIPVIQQFSLTISALECSKDGVHFEGYPQDTIVQMLALNMC